MDDLLKSDLIAAVIELARTANPAIALGEKYGGKVFMADIEVPSSLAGGVFASQNHVSVEFSNGATFDDPNGLLEGKGKLRRHVKLTALDDLAAKDVARFMRQALK